MASRRKGKTRTASGGRNRTNRVKGHSRSPRGPNKNKPRPTVRGYSRAPARKKRR